MNPRAARFLLLCLVGVVLTSTLVSSVTPGVAPLRADVPAGGLAAVFERGVILQDRNGDDQVDFVDTRIVVPDAPTPEDVAAAAAIAARLGMETSGLTLPLVFRAADAPADARGTAFVIGRANRRVPAGVQARVDALDPGQGLVAHTPGVIVIAGRDAAGTQAAAEGYSARSPYLWNVIGRVNGETYARVARDVAAALGTGGIQPSAVSIDEIVYEKDRFEVVRATVTVSVPDGRAARARDLLAAVVEGHRRGQGTDRLNYASAAELIARVSNSRSSFDVRVPRVGLPSRYLNPPRRLPTRFEGQAPAVGGPAAAPLGGARGAGPAGAAGGGAAGRGRGPEGRRFDMTQVFTAGAGLVEDDDADGVADDTDTMIVLPSASAGAQASAAVAHVAARLGLESTGVTLPMAGFDSELMKPEEESRPLILVGQTNRLVRELTAIGKLRESGPGAGTGRVEIVPDAYHANSGVVLTGGDAAGEAAAADYLARRAPYLWTIGRGQPTLDDAKDQVRKTLAGRTTAAQAALATKALGDVLDQITSKALDSIEVHAYFEEASPALDSWIQAEVSRRFATGASGPAGAAPTVTVRSHARMAPVQIFEQAPDLVWEVDAFWQKFRASVVPAIDAGEEVSVELRVSEAPEQRRQLADEIRREITRAGGKPGRVSVLSAYKQGLSWITDEVAPALTAARAARVEIGWRPFPVAAKTKERFQNEPARWLNELYPADDVLAQQLKLPLGAISFYMLDADPAPAALPAPAPRPPVATGRGNGNAAPPAAPRAVRSPYRDRAIYSVTARNAAGAVVLQREFSPATYERPYLDAFPDYATATVVTGWVRARVGDVQVVDDHLATDSDHIWDYYQGTTLKAVYDHVRQSTGNRPTRDRAPYFHTLRVELQASEPDYLLGIDQEHITALESLHDDIYFDTLDFFNQVAEVAAGGEEPAARALAAGNVLPWIHPERRGRAPSLKITYSGFASKDPKVVVSYKERGQTSAEPTTVTRLLQPVTLPEPYIYLAETTAGADALTRLGVLVTLPNAEPLPRLADLLDNLTRLQSAGLFEHAFPLAGLKQLSIRLEAPGAVSARTYRVSAPPATPLVPQPYTNGPLVTWDHVISPDESERISHTLGTLPNVTTYVAGRSYQGRPVSVMEIRLPIEAELISQAKLNAWKPVLSIVGRQHANEVSSTSHILRLAELLATDPQYQKYLRKMNVVMQPVVNPDGAALAYELQKLTPTHCLHAGRYSALGPDVPGQANVPDTLLTEALVMRDVSRRWVADVSLNPHGYPSHEWVQQFGNYNPRGFRSYWIPRGWYTSASAVEDPRLRVFGEIVDAMRDYIADEVSRDPLVRATNLRIYDRYRRWTIRWQPHIYDLEVHNDTAIYYSRRGTGVSAPTAQALQRTLSFSGGTEAMDETAQGPWLDLVTRMGFGYLMASVRFLDEGAADLYRMEGETGAGVRIAVMRPRPVKPRS